jgi:hypothetical protein
MAATYADTVLLESRLWLQENANKKFEQRVDTTQILPVFLAGQEYIPNLAEVKAATTQATSVMYLKKKAFTVNSSKACTHAGETGGSGKATVSWIQRGVTVQLQKKKYYGNELAAILALANDFYEAEKSIWFGSTGIDAVLLAYMETNRTQVNALSTHTESKNTWRGAANYDVTVANANRGQFWNYANSDMALNNYTGNFFDIYNTYFDAFKNYYSSQGIGNSTNTAFQFANLPANFITKPSNLITPAGYFDSVHYIIPEGGVAALFWNDPVNRGGDKTAAGEWTIMESMFFPGIFFDVHIVDTCADTTNDGGGTQDSVKDIEMTLNIGITKQPLSTSNETPIFKYQVYTT